MFIMMNIFESYFWVLWKSLDVIGFLIVCIDKAFLELILFSGSLGPDFVNQDSGAIEETALDERADEEHEDGQWNVGIPHLNSIDVAFLAWSDDGASLH